MEIMTFSLGCRIFQYIVSRAGMMLFFFSSSHNLLLSCPPSMILISVPYSVISAQTFGFIDTFTRFMTLKQKKGASKEAPDKLSMIHFHFCRECLLLIDSVNMPESGPEHSSEDCDKRTDNRTYGRPQVP